MSLVNIPVMGSAQDLRRQLRYSTSRRTTNTKSGRGPYYNQIPETVDLKKSNYTIPMTAPGKFTSNIARNINPNASNNNQTKTKTTNIQPASSFSFPNTANINPPNPTHFASHMSVTSRASVPISNPQHRSTSSSRSYVPPPPSLRNYQTREGDRTNHHSNNHYSTVPRSSSIARSTTSNRTNRDRHQSRINADTRSARPRSRAPSPYRSLTLPDEPEINRVFPNSDPNQVTDMNVPIPSGYVSFKISTSKVRPNAGAETRTRTSTVPSVAAPLGSAPRSRRPTSQTAASTSRTSRIPFIPPNNVPSVAPAPKPLTRSPSRPRSPSHITRIQPSTHVDTSPSSATGDSNAGPRVREGQVLSGLTARMEPEVSESRSVSQAIVDQNFSRGRTPRRSLHSVQDVPADQARNHYSTSRVRSMVHPPPSISGSSAIPNAMPIPVPTPITHSQTLPPHAATIPRELRPRKAMPFLDVGKNHMRQFGKYIPYPKRFRQNRAKTHGDIQPQDPRFGQEDYQTRSIDGRRSHNVAANTLNGSTGGVIHAHDGSHPAVMTRSPSRHQNQRSRSRSASQHSRHSKHDQRSQHTRHSYRARSVHDTRAPVEVRFEGDQGVKNTRRNRAFKWKWPTAGFGMGKLVTLNSNLRSRGLVENGADPSTNILDVGTARVVQDSHKHVWTKLNPSANWHLPQIKYFTPSKTPVGDSQRSELPPRPILHPLLRTPTLFRPARLHWDVRNQALPVMSSTDTAMMQKLLKEPATSPPTTRMLILVRSPASKRSRGKRFDTNPKFWEVDVFPSPASRNHPHPYIKCMDVLRAFGKMLRTSADTLEFDSLDIMHQHLVVRAFEMRAAGIFGRQGTDLTDLEREKAREIRKGYRKVDLLVNQTRWDGLQSTGSKSNEWIVKLGRVPFNPF